ncbi:MAG: zinc ribbon domain-containing protein [Acidobacteria bacterium]|nr:zinc ribbon domain-containing protein [Acidobacteriota bacterium]MBI3473412.1 zinc ribbon domain-containing protein [Candidatus Solibacter usitatus]
MPIYEYRCTDCRETFEQLRRMADADRDLVCPACASKRVERLFSSFATAGCASAPGRFR